jgi:hypothetical protein
MSLIAVKAARNAYSSRSPEPSHGTCEQNDPSTTNPARATKSFTNSLYTAMLVLGRLVFPASAVAQDDPRAALRASPYGHFADWVFVLDEERQPFWPSRKGAKMTVVAAVLPPKSLRSYRAV